jgi:uncharacterized membrane protein YciS (DUF1049 family)
MGFILCILIWIGNFKLRLEIWNRSWNEKVKKENEQKKKEKTKLYWAKIP